MILHCFQNDKKTFFDFSDSLAPLTQKKCTNAGFLILHVFKDIQTRFSAYYDIVIGI